MTSRMNSVLGALLVIGSAACGGGGTQTSIGSIGTVDDVRPDLPAAVRAKAPKSDTLAGVEVHELSSDIAGALVKLTWHTWADGGDRFILSYEWTVVTGKEGIVLSPRGHLNPVNVGSGTAGTGAVVEEEIVRVWFQDTAASGTQGGERSFSIKGDGTGKQI